jgi:methylthioxylose transferase
MASTGESPPASRQAPAQPVEHALEGKGRWAVTGWLLCVALMLAAVLVPRLTGWNVLVRWWPPLHGDWDPRVGPGTLPAFGIAALVTWQAARWTEVVPWRRLLLVTYGAGLAWMLALATVDGLDGIGEILEHDYEYLQTAREVDDFPAMLREYVSRISYDAEPRNWPVHIAGHPPGAVLFFIVLVRIGLGSGLAAGLVVTAVAATTALAVMTTLRVLGAEQHARRAAPYLAVGPAAIWQSVSADAVFAAVGCWGVAALAAAAVAGRGRVAATWSVVAGLLLGYLVMMSYGLWLYGIVALTTLALGVTLREAARWRPFALVLPLTAVVAAAVVAVFAAYGFAYWEAVPELRERYYDGIGGQRPASYWLWGGLGAFGFSAGPAVGAAAGLLLWHARHRVGDGSTRVVAWLAAAGLAMVLAADASQMSKAEVERIWLPFVPWALAACALLPSRWWRLGIGLQVVAALVVQHLVRTTW